MDESELEARKALRKRQRMAAERLLDNSSLRDALTDDQGQQLLDWGLAQAKAAAERTAKLPAAEGDPALEDHVTAVSDVMRQVNRLVELWPSASEEDIGNNLKKLLAGLRAVHQTALTTSPNELIETLSKPGKERDAATAFTDLMRLISGGETGPAATPPQDEPAALPAATPQAKPAQPSMAAVLHPAAAAQSQAKTPAAAPVQEEKEEGVFAGLRRFMRLGDSAPADTEETNEES